jgi:hypothetical protein
VENTPVNHLQEQITLPAIVALIMFALAMIALIVLGKIGPKIMAYLGNVIPAKRNLLKEIILK